MTKIDLLDYLTAQAKEQRLDVNAALKRNTHMHAYRGKPISQNAIDAILVGFINSVGVHQGVDLALYTRDLEEDAP